MLTSWIIYNGTLPGTKFERQANLITQAAEPLGIQTETFRNDDVRFLLPLDESFDALPHAVFFFDKDAALAERFEASGCLTMNRSDVIRLCDDKVAQTLAFQRANLPMPETIIAPKSFPKSVTLSDEALHVVTERLGLPLIVKEAHGGHCHAQQHSAYYYAKYRASAHTLTGSVSYPVRAVLALCLCFRLCRCRRPLRRRDL